MKNMKVSLKLFVSFAVVTCLCIIIGIVGIVGMGQINTASKGMYIVQTTPLPELAKTIEYIQRLRIQFRNAILFTGNTERLKTVEAEIKDRTEKFESYVHEYGSKIVDPKGLELYEEAMTSFKEVFEPALHEVLEGAKVSMNQASLMEIMDKTSTSANLIVNNFTECMNLKVQAAETESNNNEKLYMQMLILIIIVIIIAIFISCFFAVYISGLISKPLMNLTSFMNRAGTTGDIVINKAEQEDIEKMSKVKDEVGQCITSTANFIKHLTVITKELKEISEGDLTTNMELLSDRDTMGLSLIKMADNLNDMFSEINVVTMQVASGSRQIAEGSQILAQGSTEQASAIEQLSSSMLEISEKTKVNAGLADQAAKLANTIKNNAEKGSTQMDEMILAVKEINQSSHDIGKVIKVIDDIAFQTNILALNAAVEAARAGEHGKGFAVVAEEVRSLAAKSAEAAKDTESIIANSIEKAGLGVRIADETAASLVDIVEGINESTGLFDKIAKSSDEQSAGISQINKGIEQVANVVQQNSATSQESAAASEEMSEQSGTLQKLVARFKIKNEGKVSSLSTGSSKKRNGNTERNITLLGNNDSFGKY